MKEKVNKKQENGGLKGIGVCGFKSLISDQHIEIRPLTILAGANSSGKSSIMQPLLMLKQTLESSFDPGPLLLFGPHVKFSSADQFLSHHINIKPSNEFHISLEVDENKKINILFERVEKKRFEIKKMQYIDSEKKIELRENMTNDEIISLFPDMLSSNSNKDSLNSLNLSIARNRCFLSIRLHPKDNVENYLMNFFLSQFDKILSPSILFETRILDIIHLPGLRGNPYRTYEVTGVSAIFPGTFEKYTASIIAKWQEEDNNEKLEKLGIDLDKIGLTWKVKAVHINDTQVELQVGRLFKSFKGRKQDMVNIADVGFGVSQVLPILVALHVAKPDQLVYVEQPEIHLHPRAQVALADILASAANRGIKVVIETHSALVLQGIQSLVAEGNLQKELVKLYWFQRKENGSTQITSTELDDNGAFGNWPEDFAEVSLISEGRYLDAVESKMARN